MPRTATISRTTRETDVRVALDLDGRGRAQVATGLGFFDHMLVLLAGHGLFDLEISCTGDLQVDGHHTVEDVGRSLGAAFATTLGERRGIRRYGHCILPMDEALVTTAVDLGGRAACVLSVSYPVPAIGAFDTQLVEVFWEGFAATAGANIHALLHHGRNAHHIAEAVFKSLARSLRDAVEIDPRQPGIPSTKGWLA